ncbi:FMN-binding protein MioC [Neptunicella sp. SCSIO 80796]|uniref:FMN-binding protein MioC n=1 Tax=Neptunicella plasticusilytica TaxID=3117012 RepID=UPI003A4D32B6
MRVEIIVGSMLGASEYVADALAAKLETLGIHSEIYLTPDMQQLDQDNLWCICTSTHGAGDLPDNIQPFAEQLKQQQLPRVNYIIIGLGDSSYDTFCEGGKQMHQLMQSAKANSLSEPLYIDVLHHPIPEDEAETWLENLFEQPQFKQYIKPLC